MLASGVATTVPADVEFLWECEVVTDLGRRSGDSSAIVAMAVGGLGSAIGPGGTASRCRLDVWPCDLRTGSTFILRTSF